MGAHMIKRLDPWHEKLIDWLILHPERPRRECAEAFGVTYVWLSMVINSDIFRERLAERHAKHADLISRSVIDQAQAVAEQSLEVISERLEAKRDSMPVSEVREIASLALRTLGLSGSAAGPAGINANTVNILSVDGAALERARARMRDPKELTIEAEHPVLPAPQPAEASG